MTARTESGASGPATHVRLDRSGTRDMMNILANLASWVLGIALLLLSAFVSFETVARKAFNFSFQGADELGGYVLAAGSSLAFVVALVDRAHIRIDVLHNKFPKKLQAVMDWLSIVSLALLGLFMLYVGRIVIDDTLSYGSTAPTPWATPLIYPQAAWYAALALFALCAVVMALKATRLLISGRLDEISARFHPKGVVEELEEEITDLKRR
jgi:TRAP-type C4-dicarboxylate transport system permease small subunit